MKVNRLLLKNISVVGAGWGEYLRTDPGYPARQWAALEPLLRDGTLVVPEPTLHPLDELRRHCVRSRTVPQPARSRST